MKHSVKTHFIAYLVMLTTASAAPAFGAEDVGASFLYTLSNFVGRVPFEWTNISVDDTAKEVYVPYASKVKIFNETGMETYGFNEGMELGFVMDTAVDKDGNIITLAYHGVGAVDIVRCNYRGERIANIELKGLPAEFADIVPNRIFFRKGSLYLVSTVAMKVVVTDGAGVYKDGYDLASLLEFTEEDRFDTGIVGFSIDEGGSMLFTLPAIARAYVVSPDRKVRSFGSRGSSPGKFGVPGGIVADATGKYLLIVDTLRCKVMIYDRTTFRFLNEFGGRGLRPGNLIAPRDLAIDRENRLYVSQMRKRGINVYQISL